MHCKDSNRHNAKHCVGSVLALLLLAVAPLHAAQVDSQRDIFKRVYETVELGDWSPVDGLSVSERQLLEGYVLWPDLRAAWLRANLGDVPDAEINAFLGQHGMLKPARQLRYRYALLLAKQGRFADFRSLYEQFYQGQGVARLDCLALRADIETGHLAGVSARAIDLWLVGTSQAIECDPVFDYLKDNRLLGPVEHRKRFDLAIDEREFQLARWLAKQIDEEHQEQAALWIQAQGNPERFLNQNDTRRNSETYREQLVYAAERLTYRNPELAARLWKKIERRYGFAEEQKLRTRRHIALWTARDNLPDGYRLLTKLPTAAQNDEVLRWRARTSLRDDNWARLLLDINAMSESERTSEEWQYWQAIALKRTRKVAEAEAMLTDLSKERSYYGFLAADELGKEYALLDSHVAAGQSALSALAAMPNLVRARELFLTGLDGRGRSEWDAALKGFDESQKLRAAILADRWGWHSRAIATIASLGRFDDLTIRYPLPWKREFEIHSSAAQIAATWAYGVARSESLFMRDVRSSAGAIGVMQLMPATGKDVARGIKMPYSGLATLTDPESNIRLGTSYLGQMAERFGGNQVLATAAYNAGPHRVNRWLPENGSEDARVWIETIPFNETRKYVKRVLAAQAIFHWRMTGQLRRVTVDLQRVSATAETRLASR